MANALDNLNTLELLALSKLVSTAQASKASSELTPGEHTIDTVLHLTGTITKGEDYSQQIANKIDWTLLTACLFGKVNEATAAAALADYEAATGKIEKELKASANAKVAYLKTKTDTPCNGKVTSKLSAEPVS